MTQIPSGPDPPGPVWTAAAVARRLGVAPGTLRSWSRRYGVGPAAHVAGQHRRYTSADVAELDAMHELITQGVVHSAAAALASEHRRPAQDSSGPAPASDDHTEDALVRAAARLDLDTTTAILAADLDRHGVVATWQRLCRPALHDLDTAVAADRGCGDAHLLLSWAISTCLHRLSAARSRPDERPVLLACPAGEHHTLPMEVLFAALSERRTPARMLGATVPGIALRHATRQLRPSAVVVWAQRARTATPRTLQSLIPLTGSVLAAGPGWRHCALPAGAIPVDDLDDALAELELAAADNPGAGG